MTMHPAMIKFLYILNTSGNLPIEVDVNDLPKDPFLHKTTEFPPTLPPKMKQNISDSHLISQHQQKLPTRTKRNSDSRLANYQHEQHEHTMCTGDRINFLPLECVQETTLSQYQALTLSDSESSPPPLPPKPMAT